PAGVRPPPRPTTASRALGAPVTEKAKSFDGPRPCGPAESLVVGEEPADAAPAWRRAQARTMATTTNTATIAYIRRRRSDASALVVRDGRTGPSPRPRLTGRGPPSRRSSRLPRARGSGSAAHARPPRGCRWTRCGARG